LIGENSRLVPTYRDGLPDPAGLPAPQSAALPPSGELPPLRGADITGSIAPSQNAVPATSDSTGDPETANPAHPSGLPDRDNPLRLHVAANGAVQDKDELAVLKDIAELHRKTGRKIHIHGVSRGLAGDADTSLERVRRLHRHTGRAIAVLVRFGVSRDDISTSTAEQRMTGVYLGASRPGDRDRLEFSLQ
jgi:hypothetical protein